MSANMKIAEPYHLNRSTGPWDAIVIGSGIGGLGAAALLSRYGGKRVLVLERHYTPGGFTHTFRRPGYEWDVGVHYVGEAAPGQAIRAVFDAVTDGSLEWAPLGAVYDRIVIGADTYELRAGVDNLRRDLKRHFPREAQVIDRYLAMVAEVVAASGRYFMAKALPAPIAALAGPLLRRSFMRYAQRTTRSVLEELTRDQRLIAVLTGQWGDFGLPPAQSSFAIHAIVANHYFEGAYYPVGGAGRIFDAIAPVIEAGGGKVLINAGVSGIATENGRAVGVTMSDGAVIRAPLVISDAGVINTFGRLLPGDVAERCHPDRTALEPSIAHLCLYLGLRHTADELGLPKSNLLIYPDERHERTFANALEDPAAAMPPVYISFPSAKDPDYARRHPGRATIDVITLARWDSFARWSDTRWKKRPQEYGAMKEKLTARLLEVVYRHLPQIKGRIDVCELSTPITTRHFSNYANGEIYGLAHTPARFREPLLRPRTSIRGLFLTGQDVTACGVAGALMGAVLCASAILRRNLVRSISRSIGERGYAPAGAEIRRAQPAVSQA
jgi:all-trans-retinol 13,14-reductase